MSESLMGTTPMMTESQTVTEAETSAPAPTGWSSSLPEDLQGLVKNKGWSSPDDALRSYKQLESFMGADKAGRGLVMPKGEDDVDGYNTLYSALGRPETATDYGLEALYDGLEANNELLGNFSQLMHKSGLSTNQAKTLATAYRDMEVAAAQAEQARIQQEYAVAAKEVPPVTQELARRAMRHLGLSPDQHLSVAQSIEKALGPKQALEIMAKFGELLGEDNSPADNLIENKQTGFNMSPQSATNRINSLMRDDNFVKRYMSGDPSATGEMERLSKLATAG